MLDWMGLGARGEMIGGDGERRLSGSDPEGGEKGDEVWKLLKSDKIARRDARQPHVYASFRSFLPQR